MKLLIWFSRVFVGVLFIFSGLVKLNDPLGFSYKLEDYFAPDVLNLMFLEPFALSLAVFLVILEVLLGVALLLGFKTKLTVWSLFLLIVFFTFLTFYSAYFNKVTDCGCFGDAIPLTPWQSFFKDIILLVFILILLLGQRTIKPLFYNPKVTQGLLAVSVLLCAWFGYHVLNHLPVKDFRPYAVGKNLEEGMKSADELGLEGPEFQTIFTMKNKETGEQVEISNVQYSDEKWWEKTEYELLSDLTRFVKVKDGYEPPIHDFSITLNGADVTWEVLQKDEILVFIASNLKKSNGKALEKLNQLANPYLDAGGEVVLISSTGGAEAEAIRHEVQHAFPYATMDETTLKTIVRSNPGILLLRKGTVIGKWHYNDLPTIETLNRIESH